MRLIWGGGGKEAKFHETTLHVVNFSIYRVRVSERGGKRRREERERKREKRQVDTTTKSKSFIFPSPLKGGPNE